MASSASSVKGPLAEGDAAVEQQLSVAEEHLTALRLPEALTCLENLHKAHSNNASVLDLLGETLLQLNRPADAMKAFEQSCRYAPDANHMKWMQLGQLKGGADGLRAFERGVQLLLARQSSGDARALSSAYCSMVELYMTDLCDEPNAESECERLVAAAVTADPQNAEAHYMTANLRLVQQRYDEARSALSDCLKVIHELDMESDELDYSLLLNVSKACIELEDYDNALSLLNLALHQDDTIGETWYLAALVCYRDPSSDLFSDYATGARRKDVQIDPTQLADIAAMEAEIAAADEMDLEDEDEDEDDDDDDDDGDDDDDDKNNNDQMDVDES